MVSILPKDTWISRWRALPPELQPLHTMNNVCTNTSAKVLTIQTAGNDLSVRMHGKRR